MKKAKTIHAAVNSTMLIGAALALPVVGVQAFDPTGTYEGVRKCEVFDEIDGKSEFKFRKALKNGRLEVCDTFRARTL